MRQTWCNFNFTFVKRITCQCASMKDKDGELEAKRLIYGHQTSRAFQPYFDEVTSSSHLNEGCWWNQMISMSVFFCFVLFMRFSSFQQRRMHRRAVVRHLPRHTFLFEAAPVNLARLYTFLKWLLYAVVNFDSYNFDKAPKKWLQLPKFRHGDIISQVEGGHFLWEKHGKTFFHLPACAV